MVHSLVIEKKIRPMALCAGLLKVEVRALEALGMGGDYPRLTQKHNPGPKTHKLRQSRKG